MSNELEKRVLAALCKSREEYERVKPYITDKSALSATATICAEAIEGFYARDPDAGAIPKEVLAERATASLTNPKHVEAFKNFVGSLDWDVSVPNLLYDIRQLKRSEIGTQLVSLLANRQTGRNVDTLISEYQELGEEIDGGLESDADRDNAILNAVGSQELVDRFFKHEGQFTFPYPSLNRICAGGARRGHHILVFARPEIGKTLITLDIVGHLLPQYRVLYIGNEDPISDITLRLFCRLCGITQDEVRRNPGKFDERAFSRGYANFIGASLAPGRFDEIDDLSQEFQPDVVVLDQLRNLDTGDDNRVTGLEKAAVGARNLAKRSGVLCISVTQAGESAEGKSHLEFSSDIDFSKTGIPGAIDVAIGIGGTRDDLNNGIRTINVSKNKLGGLHDSFQVTVDTRTGIAKEHGK
jgi:AAA domain